MQIAVWATTLPSAFLARAICWSPLATTNEPPDGTSASLAISVPDGAEPPAPAVLLWVSGASLSLSVPVELLDELDDDAPVLLDVLLDVLLGVVAAAVEEPAVLVVAVSELPQAASSAAPVTTPAPIAVRRVTDRPRDPQLPVQGQAWSGASVTSRSFGRISIWVIGFPIGEERTWVAACETGTVRG
ncbi:MAG: hypothetical protein ABJA16_05545 [Nakamurella sp.]